MSTYPANTYTATSRLNQVEIKARINMAEALRAQYDGRTCPKCWTTGTNEDNHCTICGWWWVPIDPESLQAEKKIRKPKDYGTGYCEVCGAPFERHNAAHRRCPEHPCNRTKLRAREREEEFIPHRPKHLTANHPWKSVVRGLK